MSTKASDVAARLGRSLAPTPAVVEPASSAAAGKPARATERFTVDLAPDLNDALGEWAHRAKRAVGRRVPKTEVARVLVELLLEDASLAAQVEERLVSKPSIKIS